MPTSPDSPLIPYAERVMRGNQAVSICPRCWKEIPLHERKDFESYSGREYAEHYVRNHRGNH